MQIFIGLIGIGISYLLIKYRNNIIGFTGPWGFAERYLGGGGSYFALIIVAVIFFFLSISYMMGDLQLANEGLKVPDDV